jgi:hypothetical protein
MNQGMMNTVMSAIVGGIVGAGVVFFAGGSGGTVDLKNIDIGDLKVARLTITEQATLLNQEGTPEVVLREGSILAENVILARKMIARQLQGHAMVANRVFTTPDDLFTTPMENWRFFAEIGSSVDAGGEIVVRSASGAASVNRPTNSGALMRAGFDPESRPQIIALQNFNRSPVGISNELSDTQKQMLAAAMANPQGMMPQGATGNVNPNMAPSSFNSDAAAPINYQQGNPAIATPDANMMR